MLRDLSRKERERCTFAAAIPVTMNVL